MTAKNGATFFLWWVRIVKNRSSSFDSLRFAPVAQDDSEGWATSLGGRRRSFGVGCRIGWGGLFVGIIIGRFVSLIVGLTISLFLLEAEGFADVARGGAERVASVAIAFLERVAG